jgi:DNA-binding GntR family transcriptional regulator
MREMREMGESYPAPNGRRLGYRTISEAVYQRLRREILDGVPPPGERLDQDRLCRDFQISRTPLREVLQRLEAEGLVDIRFHRGAVVSRLDRRDIEELYAIRGELEGYAARLATQRRTSEAIAELKQCLENMARATEAEEFERLLDIHRDFHAGLYRTSGNRNLVAQISQLRTRCEWFRRVHIGVPKRAQTSLAEHLAILNAYESGDPERTEGLVRENLTNTARTLLDRLRVQEPT